ncbi:MAG TPA: response regulator [Gammaproteobacteria bacterium]
MHAHATQEAHRPRLLFVDDEQRVLNSMRIMFRRQFELFLASHGAEALDIVRDKDIDVIVADHRMPKMTGVEVLSKVRTMSPRTVRILLTGYADLDAVEGSINESEVFRFLTKPCAPQQLRETIELAAKLAREAPAPAPTEPLLAGDTAGDTIEIILQADTVTEVTGSAPPVTARTSGTAVLEQPKFPPPRVAEAPAPASAARSKQLATGLGIVVFSMDNEVVDCVNKAVRGRLPVYNAGNIVQVVKYLTEQRPGVLVTDVSEDKATIQSMTARLKEHVPQLVTIAVSQHRDVLDMVWLINHGQIFRFLRKPLSAGRTAISLQAALQHHRQLLKNPELAKRHEVDASAGDAGVVDGVLSKLKGLKRLWNS